MIKTILKVIAAAIVVAMTLSGLYVYLMLKV